MNREKLVRSKLAWARDGRLLVADTGPKRRLPPGQHLVRDWPVLDLGQQPNLGKRDWRLVVGGLVERPLDWGWAEFARLRTAETTSDIHCVTGWSRYDNRWSGVPAAVLLADVRPRADAKFVILKSFDGYATGIDLDDFAAPGVLLATHWDGQPLTREHGGPVRLVVPHLYFWKSAKWLRHIWFADREAKGYWEARGYHRRGNPWRQERYG